MIMLQRFFSAIAVNVQRKDRRNIITRRKA